MMTQVLTQQKKTYKKIGKIQEEMSVMKEEVSFIKDELSIMKRERIKRAKWQFENKTKRYQKQPMPRRKSLVEAKLYKFH